jgi:eukaryotic-like serine/threonine-protein kinase
MTLTTDTELLAALHVLLNQVIDLTPEKRDAWFARLRTEQPAYAAELEALLAAEPRLDAQGFLSSGPFTEQTPPPGLVGQRVGAYTLERLLGRGGMGSVWLARRSDGRYEGTAAVKFLNLALLDPVGSERFRREGSVLARLTHPNIARLIDAGLTGGGQPYLVLEHVEGQRIDEYCNEQRLPPEERIRLFLQVLSAVGHAHANLIVHRDLKPSNILVTPDRTVKLLDFGIAKLLEPDTAAGEQSALTDLGGLALTPEYAAPEQAAGGSVTTATDVYALGVLLYLLLGGRHPTGEGCETPAEYIRNVVETEPPRLSAVVSGRVHRRYVGDLDNILAKALKKEPGERYASVIAFADDLQRHLDHQPVSARPDSVSYRMTKFVRRHRTGVAAAALVVLAVIAGLTGTIIQAERATRQTALAKEQRDRADREAGAAKEQRDFALRQLSRAEAINDLNQFVLTDAAPSGKPFTVGDLLARAESIVDRQHAESDVNRAEMLVAIGRQYQTQEEGSKARALLGRAYEISRRVSDHSTRAAAACALASALGYAGEFERAEQLIRDGMAELPDQPQYALDRITCLLRGSEVGHDGPNTSVALERAQTAQQLLKQVRFPSKVLETRVLMDLAESYRWAGRSRDADNIFREAHARLTALGRENTQTAATLLNNWALSLYRMGQPLKAESLYRRAIQISQAGRAGTSVWPTLLLNYALTLVQLQRLVEARRYAERAYTEAQRAGNEIIVNYILLTRASVYRQLGALGRADSVLAEAEARLKRMFASDAPQFAALALQQGFLAQSRGDFRTALEHMDRAIGIAQKRQQPDYVRKLRLDRAELKLQMHRFADAQAEAEGSLEMAKELGELGIPSSNLGNAYLILGRALQGQGERDRARAAFISAVACLRPSLGPRHPKTRMAERLASEMGIPAK